MTKYNRHRLYYARKTHLKQLERAVDDFIIEADKLLPISEKYKSFGDAQKWRYDAAITELSNWLRDMFPLDKKQKLTPI